MDPDTEIKVPMILQNNNNNNGKTSEKFKQYVAAISVSLGAVCAGTCLAWTSPALSQLCNQDNTTTTTTLKLSETQAATVGGILPIGALIFAIPAGYFADKYGRKLTIQLLSLLFLVNWLLIIFAQNPIMLIIGRFFAGLGTGAICVTAPMYIGEIADTSIRGVLNSFFQMFMCIGILFTCIIGTFTNFVLLSSILAVIPLCFGLAFYFMPETHVFLMKQGKIEKARSVLRGFRGEFYDIESELKIIQREIEESQNNFKQGKSVDIFLDKGTRRALISAIGVLAFQQLSGINAVVFYTVPIFKSAGSSLSPDLVGILIGLVQVLGSYLSILIIEKANRKFYLIISSMGMLICLASIGMYFHLKKINYFTSGVMGYLPIGSAVLFMVSFSMGYGPVPWMLLGELFGPEIKGLASGCAILTNWSFAFLITFSFPILNNYWGAHFTFYSFALLMAFGTVFVYFVVPETRGKTLLEIQRILNK